MEMETKHGTIKIFAREIKSDALSQIIQMANSPLGENAHIRVMPDAHAGAGCVIGTTMLVTDKVCPNLVGVDIGCGVDYVETEIDFGSRFEELDNVIRRYIPFGMARHNKIKPYDFSKLLCWKKLSTDIQQVAMTSLGTLGGGNHFIEAYAGGGLSVHSGSRNIGKEVASYYQKLAERSLKEDKISERNGIMGEVQPTDRSKWLKENKISFSKELAYLEGSDLTDYLHDVQVMQGFADANRMEMLKTIVTAMGGSIKSHINSIHNYIEVGERIVLRKGAINADSGRILVIPMNMRDGLLICKGKGNPDWNNSAPHGAGREYSRSDAKKNFTVEEYEEAMKGIFSTCIGASTLDEAPFAYKDFSIIMECIEPTVEILDRKIPIYNFKAN